MSSPPSPPFLPSILPPPTLPLILDLRAVRYYCQVTDFLQRWGPGKPCLLFPAPCLQVQP